jgi:signal peptidase I
MRTFALLSVLLSVFLVTNCGNTQDLKRVKAEGLGMAPTIRDGDQLVIDRSFYKRGNTVNRFDVIAFLVSSELFHYKRVIGLPNENIEIRNGEVFIDGRLLQEPFDKEPWAETNFGPILIPQNEYFVLGDNRPNSADSRIWEPATIKQENILGKIVDVVPSKK